MNNRFSGSDDIKNIYYTSPFHREFYQFTFEDIINGNTDPDEELVVDPYKESSSTITRCLKKVPNDTIKMFNEDEALKELKNLLDRYSELANSNMNDHYRFFKIPKKSFDEFGRRKMREIHAPDDTLKAFQSEFKRVLEKNFFATHSTYAFAYVHNRCPVTAVQKHQKNESKWFLKLDLHDFFGSTTWDFTISMLSITYPFNLVLGDMANPEIKDAFLRALSMCFLNGRLVQGSVTSPMLTNLVMIPFDVQFAKNLRKWDTRFCFTRYADDMHISNKVGFNPAECIRLLKEAMQRFNAPYTLSEDKTHYGNINGSNFMLGVVLNRDNKITIGHHNHKKFHAMLANYILDRQNHTPWTYHEIAVLSGRISYYLGIEREYIERCIEFNNKKFNCNIMNMIHDDIAGRNPEVVYEI